MALKDALTTVMNRNAFYRDGYRLLLRVSIIQGLLILILTGGLVALLLSMETRQVYFATTTDGRIINIVPMNEPFRTNAEVVAWAAGTTQNVMRFGYHDYRQHLQQVSSSFTTSGWESFTRALKEARVLEAVDARKLVVTLEVKAAPEIKNAFVKDGVYTWFLRMPIVIKFDGNDAPGAISAMLTLQIVRVSTLQNSDGISIEQWIAKPN
jgi:intracellular multiplication protein IcmL